MDMEKHHSIGHHLGHHLKTSGPCGAMPVPVRPCWCTMLVHASNATSSESLHDAAAATCGTAPASESLGCWHGVGHSLFLARFVRPARMLSSVLPGKWTARECEQGVAGLLADNHDLEVSYLSAMEETCASAGSEKLAMVCSTGLWHLFFRLHGANTVRVCQYCLSVPSLYGCLLQAGLPGLGYEGITSLNDFHCEEFREHGQLVCHIASLTVFEAQGGDPSQTAICQNASTSGALCMASRLLLAFFSDFIDTEQGKGAATWTANICHDVLTLAPPAFGNQSSYRSALSDYCTRPRFEWFVALGPSLSPPWAPDAVVATFKGTLNGTLNSIVKGTWMSRTRNEPDIDGGGHLIPPPDAATSESDSSTLLTLTLSLLGVAAAGVLAARLVTRIRAYMWPRRLVRKACGWASIELPSGHEVGRHLELTPAWADR